MSFLNKDNRIKIVFLGTPSVAATALEILIKNSNFFKIILVVSQPPSRSTRNGKETPSPVHELAIKEGIPVLTPIKANEIEFLNDLESLEPDLCVTAAYGNYLPQKFLSIPKFGTLNIHPSLLPKYRGAAPVQRAIENGDKVTGVSLLVTVKEMDAGPILAQETYELNDSIKSHELLENLFIKGAELLVKKVPAYTLGKLQLTDQNSNEATHADKLKPEESFLNYLEPAFKIHNKVRAFSAWPYTKTHFLIDNEIVEVKIITTRALENLTSKEPGTLIKEQNSLQIVCGDHKTLEILELQLPGKKVLATKDFLNGLRNKSLMLSQKF